jgi:hypothetical protein
MGDLDELRRRFPVFGHQVDGMPGASSHMEALASAGLIGGTLVKYLAAADDAAMRLFVEDVAACDIEWLIGLRDDVLQQPRAIVAPMLAPVAPSRFDDSACDEWVEAGHRSLRAGEWADVIFAGGAATRFFTGAGEDAAARSLEERYGGTPPKGVYPLTPVLGRSFLQRFVAEALETGIASGRLPPVVLMTSQQTSAAIRDWVQNSDHSGFPREMLWPMPQAEHPRLDSDGDLVARSNGRLVVTGDGHGGVYRALMAEDPGGDSIHLRLHRLGVRHVVLHNVDNAASRPFDAARLGFHRSRGMAFTMTVTARAHAYEKVGLVAKNLCMGRIEVIEYSVCPPEIAEAVQPNGSPVFALAHINTNLLSLSAVRSDIPRTLYTGKMVDVDGRVVPTSSHEMLNQHLSGLLEPEVVGVLLADRDVFFLPTKSLHGEDSLDTTQRAMSRADAARLVALGAEVAADSWVELDPCLGDPAVLSGLGCAQGWRVGAGATVGFAVRHGIGGRPPLSSGLVVENGARLVVQVDRPYGDSRFDSGTRAIAECRASAGMVGLGTDVTVGAGADVQLTVHGSGQIEVPAGTRFEGLVRIEALPGQVIVAHGVS